MKKRLSASFGILILLCAECGVVMMLPSIPNASLPYLAAAAIAVGSFAG